MEVKTDTLRAPGQISDVVNMHTDDNGGVLCYIPGTSYIAMTDDTGGFVLSNIPQGNYRITYRKNGLKTISDTGINVHSGEKTKLPVKNMEADPAYPPPSPAGLNVTYDTLHGCAIIRWKPVIVSDLAGYVVYRNDTASTTPQQISKKLVKDTVDIDSIYTDLMDTNNLAFIYRIKAQDKDANLSTVYSKQFTISTPSPTKVRTFFSWKYLNTIADSASINDTISFIVEYRNAARKNMKLTWYVGNNDSVFRIVNDSSFTGKDTIRYSWPIVSKQKIYASMVDEGNTTWRDSTTIIIVQDVPQITFISCDTIVDHSGSVRCSVYVQQQFGTMVLAIDTANSGTFKEFRAIGLAGGAMYSFSTLSASQWDSVKVRVTDDDGNKAIKGCKVDIRPRPLVITSIDSTVTTITVNYSQSQETDFAEYRIYRHTTNSVDMASELWATISASGTVSYTTPAPSYAWEPRYYRVYQKDNEGLWSAGSNVVYGNIVNSPPPTPVITWPASDGDSIWSNELLRWNKCVDPNNHTVKYRVMINYNNTGYTEYATELIDTALMLNYDSLGFEVKVIAYDSDGDSSDWSGERRAFIRNTVSDIDGNVYKVVRIGKQLWTAENISTTTFNDGTPLLLITDDTVPAAGYCWNNDTTDSAEKEKWGALYNWFVVSPLNPYKIAPAGWHVPTDEEWDTLQNYLIANGYNWDGTKTGNKIAKSLAAKTDWATCTVSGTPGNNLIANNSSRFLGPSGRLSRRW